jgi:hypothetical protein
MKQAEEKFWLRSRQIAWHGIGWQERRHPWRKHAVAAMAIVQSIPLAHLPLPFHVPHSPPRHAALVGDNHPYYRRHTEAQHSQSQHPADDPHPGGCQGLRTPAHERQRETEDAEDRANGGKIAGFAWRRESLSEFRLLMVPAYRVAVKGATGKDTADAAPIDAVHCAIDRAGCDDGADLLHLLIAVAMRAGQRMDVLLLVVLVVHRHREHLTFFVLSDLNQSP